MVTDVEPSLGEGGGQSRWRFADVEFDEAENALRVGGKPVVVEPRPLRLLLELLRHVNEVVTKEELLDSVWEGRPTVDHVLANAVSKLRGALGDTGAARLITVPRVGYRLAGPVQRMVARAPETVLQQGQPVPGRDGYCLERALGEGGHSDVWLAHHTKLGHAHVFKFASDGPRLSALKREYTLYRVLLQELGPRDDFARVLDTNFVAAPYFIECEFGGQSLPEWADQGGRLAGLRLDERLQVFLGIARAVAAAHRVGVLHKDLKPGNVLIQSVPDGTGGFPWQVRLTDFGSGRLLDPSRLAALQLTAMGLTQTVAADSHSGTPMYMAPEVMAGQAATVQSDVHALGILLWQLLAGDLRRPLTTGWQRDVQDELLREDITAATEGNPEARLSSAAELADRIATLEARRERRSAQRLAAQSTVQMQAQAARQRARRPWVLAAFASLAVGLLAASGFAVHARRSLGEAQQASARANALNQFMSEGLLSGLVVERLDDKANVSMTDTLQRASERAAQRFHDHPRTEAEVRLNLAQSYYRLTRFADAARELRRALVLMEPVQADTDAVALRRRLQLHLANVLIDLDQRKEASALLDAAALGLVADPTAAPDPVSLMLAQVRFKLAYGRQDYARALELAAPMVALAEALPPDRMQERFGVYMLLGDTQYFLGRWDDAQKTFSRLLQPPFGVAVIGAVQAARAQVNLCRAQVAAGKTDGVEARLIEARETLRRNGGPREVHVATASAELGNLYEQQHRFAQAEAAYREALAELTVSLGGGHASTRITRLNLAIMEVNNGRTRQGLATLEASRPWFVEHQGGEASPVVQAIDFERVRAFTTLGSTAKALQLLQTLKPELLGQATPSRDWPLRLQAERGRALLRAGPRDEGRQLLSEAVEKMPDAGTAAWVVADYRKELAPPASAR